MRKDVQNVLYFDLVQFLVQHLEVKLELSHLVSLAEFGTRVGKIFKTNLNQQHRVFEQSSNKPLFDVEKDELLMTAEMQQEREQDYLDRYKISAKKRMTTVEQFKSSELVKSVNTQ